MRVAVQGCLPNHPTAERELVERLILAVHNLGWEAAGVITSADILAFRPDCVLATHFTMPKLTEFPTLGVMTNPPPYFNLLSHSLRNILSYDGYLTGSDPITAYLGDLLASTRKKVPVSDFTFYLSCPATELGERPVGPRRLFYVGMRWDKGRHGSLFERLARAVSLDVYGPPERWADLPGVGRGLIPFDGRSVVDRIREAGAALCIHSSEHRAWGLPTMRIWEAAAAGAVILTDVPDFARHHFGDAFLGLDLEQPVEAVVEQIAAHMAWIERHPDEATEMARQAHTIFQERYCLERQFARLPAFLDQVRGAAGYGGGVAARERVSGPAVEYIVRAGTRPARFVDRCLASLRRQSYRDIGVILVQVGSGDGLTDVLARYRGAFSSFQVVRCEAGLRSHALWAGLRAVTAPYFAVLDDDDQLHPSHVASIMQVLRERPEISLAHSGGVRVQEEEGFYEDEPYLRGPAGRRIEENRRLAGFANLDRKAVWKAERALLSHSWVAHRELLDDTLLEDPNLAVLEDVYLLGLLAGRARVAFTWRPTAEWNWRSASRDNAVFQDENAAACRERVRLRLHFLPEVEAQRAEDDFAELQRQELEKLRTDDKALRVECAALRAECLALRHELRVFGWMGPAEMLALRRTSQSLLLLRGLRRSLADWRSLRRRLWRGLRTVRRQGVRGFLRHAVALGRE